MDGLLVGVMPLWVGLADCLGPRAARPPAHVIAGRVLGFTGVALLVNPPGGTSMIRTGSPSTSRELVLGLATAGGPRREGRSLQEILPQRCDAL